MPGNGLAAGAHYSNGAPPSKTTEVWLDFTVLAGGVAVSVAQVPFTIAPGTRSVVIHAAPTSTDGTAGARTACLPVQF
ncbi:MAG: hypothetical protein ACR2LJ_01400 [Acidimicrobiales bacterium]